MAQKLLDSHQVADILGIKEATLRIWRMSGKGPVFQKIGYLVKYDPAEVDRYIAAQTRLSTSQRAPVSDLAATA